MKTKETHYKEMKDWQDGARRLLVREMEQLKDEKKQLNERLRYLDATGELLSRLEDLNGMLKDRQAEVADLNAESNRLRQRRQAAEVRLSEMYKLTACMVNKVPEEDVLRAMRSYLNISKRKTQDKRKAAKMVFTELFASAKMELPEDIKGLLESLGDEQPKTDC